MPMVLGRYTLRSTDTLKNHDGSKTIKGSGDGAFRYTGESEIFKIKNSGQSNFSVIQHGPDTDLIVNEIGSFNGTGMPLTVPALIQVSSDGPWSFRVED